MTLFHRGIAQLDLPDLVAAAASPSSAWEDDGRLITALLGADRTEAALAVGAALANGAGFDAVLDAVTLAASERMLRYDTTSEYELLDDFFWGDITHALTYSNAVRWHLAEVTANARPATVDDVKLVLWAAFLANWTGRHEWHTGIGDRAVIEPLSADIDEYGRQLQRLSLDDPLSRFIWVAHGIKTSVAATREARRIGSTVPLQATHRFMFAPKRERGVAATVATSIDFINKGSSR